MQILVAVVMSAEIGQSLKRIHLILAHDYRNQIQLAQGEPH